MKLTIEVNMFELRVISDALWEFSNKARDSKEFEEANAADSIGDRLTKAMHKAGLNSRGEPL